MGQADRWTDARTADELAAGAIIGTKGALSFSPSPNTEETDSRLRVPLVKTRKVAVRGSRGRRTQSHAKSVRLLVKRAEAPHLPPTTVVLVFQWQFHTNKRRNGENWTEYKTGESEERDGEGRRNEVEALQYRNSWLVFFCLCVSPAVGGVQVS